MSFAKRNCFQTKQYFEVLKDFPICVATAGLCGSNGWKLAEYVALSKAVVSEKLCYEVTGDFGKDRNYLEFETPEQCVENIGKLFDSRDLRETVMENNRRYYQDFMRPDKIILNTLQIAQAQRIIAK